MKVSDAVDKNITGTICKIPSLDNAAGDQVLVCMQFIAVLDLCGRFFSLLYSSLLVNIL